ncbi:hypothetical protein [Ensifer canadensis]
MQIPFAKKIAHEAKIVVAAVMGTGRQGAEPAMFAGGRPEPAARPNCCAQAVSQKKFGEWGRRWYSRPNEKSRKRLERPKGFARRNG